MRAVPIPAEVEGQRAIIGESDPTRDDVRPCEYVVGLSSIFPGRYTFTALVELDDEDRKRIAEGAGIWLTLDGGELPWSLETA